MAMASSGSTRELSKALQTYYAAPTLPLPDDLIGVIEAYLDKHAESEQSTFDRLHDDLLATFSRSVQFQPPFHYAAFLVILRRLRPAIRTTPHVLLWWEKVAEPALDHMSEERSPSSKVLSDIGRFLFPDDDDDDTEEGSGAQDLNKDGVPYAVGLRLVQKWNHIYESAAACGYGAGWTREKPVQDVLVQFGKKRPKEFFHILNDFFVQRSYRTSATSLLSEFIRSQPPHLHLIIKSPLFESLLRCLQYDTSTTIVSLALTCLTMLLPNMPGSIVPYLPALFNIYARILFWDREQLAVDDSASIMIATEHSSTFQTWEKGEYSAEIDGQSTPHLLGYFNVLYGLYPLNFMDYIRKPQRYLRHANANDTDDVEMQPSEIRDRSEKYRRCHMLHPNFYSLTIESEKTDFGRWIRSATADVVAECVSLHIPTGDMRELRNNSTSSLLHVGSGGLDVLPTRHLAEVGAREEDETLLMDRDAKGGRFSESTGILSLSASSGDPSALDRRRSSQTSHQSEGGERDSSVDSPTLPPLLSRSATRKDLHLQYTMDANKPVKTGVFGSVANDSVPSLSLSHQESLPERLVSGSRISLHPPHWVGTPSPLQHAGSRGQDEDENVAPNEGSMTEMRRQILLLKNDLNFERYMVQQHLAHIGTLRRSNMRQAVTEAETQNMILANRTLKHRLEEAKKTEAQVKKEVEMSRTRTKNYEESLLSKLKKLREEQKKWSVDESVLRRDLKNAQADGARLVRLVCEAEVRELKAKQDMEMLESAAAEMDKLKKDVKALAAAERQNRAAAGELEAMHGEVVRLQAALEQLQTKMETREAEFVRTRRYYQDQVVQLNSKLTGVLHDGTAVAAVGSSPAAVGSSPGSNSGSAITDSARAQVESALAASRAKHLELQKNHTRLMRKYKVLESKSLERVSMYDDAGLAGGSFRGDTTQSSTLSDPEIDGASFRSPHMSGGGSRTWGSISAPGSGGGPASIASSGSFRQRQRVASDAGSLDPTSPATWAATVPMGGMMVPPMSPPSGAVRRPSTPSGAAGPSTTTSPHAERYYGRGGVQNSLRKERKDKKTEEPADKKDRKPSGSGIRGIRSFV